MDIQHPYREMNPGSVFHRAEEVPLHYLLPQIVTNTEICDHVPQNSCKISKYNFELQANKLYLGMIISGMCFLTAKSLFIVLDGLLEKDWYWTILIEQ